MNDYIFVLIGVLIAVALGYLILRYLDPSLRNGKWELVRQNVRMESVGFNPIWGETSKGTVYVDVYRRKMRNGIYQYKNVKRS